jgi:hypothetical protein
MRRREDPGSGCFSEALGVGAFVKSDSNTWSTSVVTKLGSKLGLDKIQTGELNVNYPLSA